MTQLFPTAEEVLNSGKTLHIKPEGRSMLPLIKAERDSVYINKVSFQEIQKGDVVLYRDEYHRLVLHRICRKTPTAFYAVGDNQFLSRGPYTADQLLGIMTGLDRNGKYLDPNHFTMRFFGSIWLLRRHIGLIIRAVVRGRYNE